MKYQKIRALGHRTLKNLWSGYVEITEKVDGSQYRFWCDEHGHHHHGSKNMELGVEFLVGGQINCNQKMFNPVVRHMESVKHLVAENVYLFGETLTKPQHNVLKYDRVPDGHLVLWGAYDANEDRWQDHESLVIIANALGIEVAPLINNLHEGRAVPLPLEILDKLLDRKSFLGGTNIEGLVFKNFEQEYLVGDIDLRFLAGKFVSDAFKEKMGVKPNKAGKFDAYKESFRTEARWLKMIQTLRDAGQLDHSPKDIGDLLKWGHVDLEVEHSEEIADWLYKHFIKQIKSEAMRGFPEFYKRWLVENNPIEEMVEKAKLEVGDEGYIDPGAHFGKMVGGK